MTKYRRIEVNAFRRRVTVVSGEWRPGDVFDAQLWARYAGPSGSAPHYSLLYDLGRDATVTLRAGDVDGDGLDDLVWTDGAVGRGQVHVLLQCDAHQTDCRGGQ